VDEGTPAKVGSVLAWIGSPGEKLEGGAPESAKSKTQKATPAPAPAAPQPSVPADTQGTGFISPVVARIAAEHAVSLQQIQGTGLGGRITKNDVLKFVEGGKFAAPGRAESPRAAPAVAQVAGDQLIKHTTIRKQIAEHMVSSQHTSPHVLTVMEADLSKVVAHRAGNKDIFARDGANLTFTAYFMAAIVAGLKAHPMVNSSWSDEGVLVHKALNLGMATSLGEEGLIVPVIKDADNLSLLAMARAINDLASRARAKKLQPDEVRGGTFTLTNHGISGSLFAFPIINQPQCGILGVGVMQKRALVIEDAIAIRPMVFLSFVFDHRILDGASADGFLAKIKETLEKWA